MAETLKKSPWVFPLLLAIAFTFAGCLYNLDLEKVTPKPVAIKDYQPIAILSIPDASGYPGSGSDLYMALRLLLAAKGYRFLEMGEAKVLDPPKARFLLLGQILEYSVQESYVRSESFPVWDGLQYEYRSLPTYHQGACQIRLLLRLLDQEKEAVVWRVEGRIRGPSQARKLLGQKLLERLLADIPPLTAPAKD